MVELQQDLLFSAKTLEEDDVALVLNVRDLQHHRFTGGAVDGLEHRAHRAASEHVCDLVLVQPVANANIAHRDPPGTSLPPRPALPVPRNEELTFKVLTRIDECAPCLPPDSTSKGSCRAQSREGSRPPALLHYRPPVRRSSSTGSTRPWRLQEHPGHPSCLRRAPRASNTGRAAAPPPPGARLSKNTGCTSAKGNHRASDVGRTEGAWFAQR